MRKPSSEWKRRPLVKCPECGKTVKARNRTFECCGHRHPVEDHVISNPSPSSYHSESDPIKEAIAERMEKGELSGSADVMVKGVPVHVEFKSKGAEGNPCPPDNPELEGKVKVFNPPKPSNPKAGVKTEEKIEEAVEGGGDEEQAEKGTLKRAKTHIPECLYCNNELAKVKGNPHYGWCLDCHKLFHLDEDEGWEELSDKPMISGIEK